MILFIIVIVEQSKLQNVICMQLKVFILICWGIVPKWWKCSESKLNISEIIDILKCKVCQTLQPNDGAQQTLWPPPPQKKRRYLAELKNVRLFRVSDWWIYQWWTVNRGGCWCQTITICIQQWSKDIMVVLLNSPGLILEVSILTWNTKVLVLTSDCSIARLLLSGLLVMSWLQHCWYFSQHSETSINHIIMFAFNKENS